MRPLSPAQIEILKEKLTAMASELKSNAAARKQAGAVVELDQAGVGRLSRMDALQQQAMAQASERRAGLELQRIEAAFSRIERGLYGICEDCDEAIGIHRLIHDPCAVVCVECARERERMAQENAQRELNRGPRR